MYGLLCGYGKSISQSDAGDIGRGHTNGVMCEGTTCAVEECLGAAPTPRGS